MDPRLSINLYSFTGTSLAQDLATCREIGIRKVGVPVAKLEGMGWQAGVDAVWKSGFGVSTVLDPRLFQLDDRASWQATRDGLVRSIDAAKTLQAESVYTLSGARGAFTWEEAAEAFAEAMKPVAAHAKAQKVPFLIEPQPALYPEMSITHTLHDAVAVAERAGIGVCIDLFACWTESGLRANLERAMPACALVQVSDYSFGDRSLPCRSVPGDGNMPLERLVGWVLEAGYRGSWEFELIGPRIEKEGVAKATARSAAWMTSLLQRLGA